MSSLELLIPMRAKPQGSKTAFVVKGRAVLTEASKGLKPWRSEVARIIRTSADGWEMPDKDQPIGVIVHFIYKLPKTSKRSFFTIKPDIDKLSRAILDAITEAGNIWHDDQQVIYLEAWKSYGDTDEIRLLIKNV